MIDNDKIGQYIKQLRKEAHLTQEELAAKLYISRQAISSWEKGKTAPSIDNVNQMSKIFDLSIADVYNGQEIKDVQTLNDIFQSVVKLEIKRWKKYLILTVLAFIALLIVYFVTYFIHYYNNIIVYNIKGNSSNYDINGIINKSVDNLYFNLEIDYVSDKICLVHNDDELLCESDSNYIMFNEKPGYNEIIPLDKNKYNDYIQNLYLSIRNNNEEEKIKLDVVKFYQNSNLFKMDRVDIDYNNDNYKLEFASVPEKIKKKFKYNEEDNYFYKKFKKNDVEVEMNYFVELKMFLIIEKHSENTIVYNYNTQTNIIEKYNKSNDYKLIINYSNISVDSKDKDKQQIYEYFKTNYIDKYLN